MEGFLRSLAEKDSSIQKIICSYSNLPAYKLKFGLDDWRPTQILYWQGNEISRYSTDYQELLTKAYDALFENHLFKKLLKGTIGKYLIHSIGNDLICESLLTEAEYRYQLNRLRDKF